MTEWKKVVIRLMEIMIIFAGGLLLTIYILKPIYTAFGILLIGNIWVNWFGVSYFLFTVYTIMVGLFLWKENILFQKRISSKLFWVMFLIANYVIFIPFIKGENPF
ncbi:hypothetical protein [Sutcliffiella rhizosphaerae]|uniref:Uncharacterized protein n=1 Tax=Sutcliffiella rhizosphaerae TaxID=2880967 RepID=A0ABM8YNG2_9BACI|nr:hypothetical protein [Sutcliffiella rhizosphaerae]CAG9621533.1 hypothetical protein BACCIP111883_02306 [Sutcliffiella rhizosphaerae]